MDTTALIYVIIIFISFIVTNMISNRFIKNRSNTGLYLLKRVGIFMGVYLVLFSIYFILFKPEI
ncbi:MULTISPECIES: hypothetical protein [Staphylococcus]|uniref:Uncharacterized protein n=2 Tax=Staphylococcus simulans TaxID=1286 RepID=A0ABP2YQJ5_STASI|nr:MULTISPECIES: hypothetical protein [Staphylococcus]MVI62573.1 hypothetical protein [Staphylococcus aureus]AMG97375.1 hypothetical protein AL483_11355 [Staphylococcus simulans]ATF30349.1 hypothetical protein CO689_05510 [Staphylococcus simulans]AVO01093.1 hypothetical protein BI282_01215 [Staphylococcus simulans]AVO04044.1 hypothetical protein BI283_01215 [Staphylococcus simulans]